MYLPLHLPLHLPHHLGVGVCVTLVVDVLLVLPCYDWHALQVHRLMWVVQQVRCVDHWCVGQQVEVV